MGVIFLAGGCFWGVENYFQNLNGVTDTEVGYANSSVTNPSYEMVCTGKTFSTEAVRITFDETILPLTKLLHHFFELIDPTVINRQGNDIGSQYRTSIYYLTENNSYKSIIESFKDEIQKNYSKKIVTEILPLENFYIAEEYHQDYLIKNPNGYCHCLSEIETLKKSKDAKSKNITSI
ncbi:MAG: peptide-methionine (S)-S-oxide reductase MsrA [Fusobacteriaceae bacterium]